MDNKRIIDLLRQLGASESKHIDMKPISYSHLVFEERVLLNCFHCSKRGVNWTCPPNIPPLNYKLVLSEYSELLLVYCKVPFSENIDEFLRRETTNLLHTFLLKAEEILWKENHPLAVSFIGGSCKLCTTGCDTQKCRQPTLARIPLEAAGVNVIKSAKNVGVEVVFPPREYLYRVGLLGW